MQILKDFFTIYTKCKMLSKSYLDLYYSNLQRLLYYFYLKI